VRDRLRQLGKDTLIYGIGGIAARALSFFLLPVYTRLFTPADYGAIEMMTIAGLFLAALMTMGLDSAQSYYFFEQKDRGPDAQARVVTAIVQWRLMTGGAIVALGMLASPWLNEAFFAGRMETKHFAVAFSGVFFMQLMEQSVQVFRLRYRPWAYIGLTLGNTVVAAAVAVTLIWAFGWGVLGYFVGMATGAATFAVLGWWSIRGYVDFGALHAAWWPRLLKFGLPLVPAAVAMYVLRSSDRWFIGHYAGQEGLGLYAVGAKFATLIVVAATTFRQAWWPVAMDAMQSGDGPALFRTIARAYLAVGVAGVVALTACSKLLLFVFVAPDFRAAYPIVGVLAWYGILYGFFLIVSGGIWKAEKTHWNAISMTIAAVVNLILNALLVPTYGPMGAAVATALSFALWNVMTVAVSEWLWPVGYANVVLTAQCAIGAAACAAILLLFADGAPAWQVALVTVTACSVVLATAATREDFGAAAAMLRRRAAA